MLAGALAVLLAPLTVGALADAASLHAAFAVVPVMLALAAVGLRSLLDEVEAAGEHGVEPPVRQPRTASRTSGVGRSR